MRSLSTSHVDANRWNQQSAESSEGIAAHWLAAMAFSGGAARLDNVYTKVDFTDRQYVGPRSSSRIRSATTCTVPVNVRYVLWCRFAAGVSRRIGTKQLSTLRRRSTIAHGAGMSLPLGRPLFPEMRGYRKTASQPRGRRYAMFAVRAGSLPSRYLWTDREIGNVSVASTLRFASMQPSGLGEWSPLGCILAAFSGPMCHTRPGSTLSYSWRKTVSRVHVGCDHGTLDTDP